MERYSIAPQAAQVIWVSTWVPLRGAGRLAWAFWWQAGQRWNFCSGVSWKVRPHWLQAFSRRARGSTAWRFTIFTPVPEAGARGSGAAGAPGLGFAFMEGSNRLEAKGKAYQGGPGRGQDGKGWHPGPVESLETLLPRVLEGHPRALARAISWLENGHPGARDLMAGLWPKLGGATVVGLTGAPGAGKSTLTDRLARAYRADGLKVGILAVDPTSPFSGGAILGDRIRMGRVAPDPGVFIRSMATRGALGGLARATQDAIDVLDAAGFDRILVETVGVGQDEVDVAACAHTCLVVLVPGLGDEIQAMKAGLMEVADCFVINKADREGVEQLERDLEAMKALDLPAAGAWDPPVIRTVAATGEGIEGLLGRIRDHAGWLDADGGRARKARDRARLRFEHLLAETALRRALDRAGAGRIEALVGAIAARRTDPWAAVADLLGGA